MLSLNTFFGVIWNLITGNAPALLQTALNFFAQKTNTDLAEVQAALPSAEHVAIAALNANAQAAAIQADMAKTVLNDPIARFAVGILIAVTAVRFVLIVFDSTYWWVFGCTIDGARIYGDKCAWNIPAIHGIYGGAEMQILLFWIIARPVDSAVQGITSVITNVIKKKA